MNGRGNGSRRESDFRGNFFHGDFFHYGFVRFVEDQGLLFESGDQNTVAGIERCGEYPTTFTPWFKSTPVMAWTRPRLTLHSSSKTCVLTRRLRNLSGEYARSVVGGYHAKLV